MKKNYSQFTEYIRNFRKTRGLLQNEMANIFKYSPSYMSSWEQQRKKVSVDFLDKMIKYFKINNEEQKLLQSLIVDHNNNVTDKPYDLTYLKKELLSLNVTFSMFVANKDINNAIISKDSIVKLLNQAINHIEENE